MKTISASAWRHQGSTLITSLAAGAELLAEAQKAAPTVQLVSLRTALRWAADGWPAVIPGISCVVISGLDAVIDRCTAEEAVSYLRSTVKLIIRASQEHWTSTSLAFLFTVTPAKLNSDEDASLDYTLPNGETVNVSSALWNGAAQDLRHVQVFGNPPQTIGYHVARLS